MDTVLPGDTHVQSQFFSTAAMQAQGTMGNTGTKGIEEQTAGNEGIEERTTGIEECNGSDSCTCPGRDVSTPPRAWDELWDDILPREAKAAREAEAEAATRAARRQWQRWSAAARRRKTTARNTGNEGMNEQTAGNEGRYEQTAGTEGIDEQ